ncbi:hypothetical protein ACHAXN_001547 [Cyclotella atomus]|jgi:hypothetical protein
MLSRLKHHDFTSLRQYNTNWAAQQEIPHERVIKFLACLLHYDGRVGNVIRFASNNYTAEHRNIPERIKLLKGLVEPDLLARYIRVMTMGAPTKFNAETTRDNTMLYLSRGNNSSIDKKIDQVLKTMNKEERNCHVIPLPCWIARYIPDVFFTPQYMLEKPGKSNRQIFNARLRHTPFSQSVNMMTSAHEGIELAREFGASFTKILRRIWNLRITYPNSDIVCHANDVKSCFRLIKHHPDVAGAFSYVIAWYMYLQCGLAFGSDFSPQMWEVCRRMAEQMAEKLFADESLLEKHRQYLDQLRWGKRLGKPADFTPAHPCSKNRGVMDENGRPVPTPHNFFVNDDCIVEVYIRQRIKQAVAASIEAIF